MKRLLPCLLLAAASVHAAPIRDVYCSDYPRSVPRYTQQDVAKAKRELEAAIQNPGPGNLLLAQALARMADSYSDGYDRVTASDLGERAGTIWAAAAPAGDLAEQLRGWGASDGRNGRCEVAKPMLQASLGMFDELYGPDDERTLRAVHDLLQVSISLADAEAVDKLAARLLPAWDKRGAVADVDRPALHLRLAVFYLKLEQFAKAEAVARQGIELALATQPANRKQAADLRNALASAYFGQLRYAEGEAALAKRIPRPDQQPPRKHKEEEIIAMTRGGDLAGATASAQQLLAQDQAKLQEDERALSEAEARTGNAKQRDTARRTVASDSANVGEMLDWLGELHQAQNDPVRAEQMYVQALGLFDKYPATDPLKASRVQFDLGILYRLRGEPARALPLQEAAMKSMLPLLGGEHPDVADSEAELARIHKSLNHYADAEPLYQRRLERLERIHAAADDVAESLEALADIAAARGDKEAAKACLQRTVALWEAAGPAGQPQLPAARGRLEAMFPTPKPQAQAAEQRSHATRARAKRL